MKKQNVRELKCKKSTCEKKCEIFIIDKEHVVVPTDIDHKELRQLFSYFQYKAPNIDATTSPILDYKRHEFVFDQIKKSFCNYVFCAQNADSLCNLENVSLEGINVCSYCKRFMCKNMNNPAKRDKTRRESDLECFLRHIRNSLAHGNVYVLFGKNYNSILFEDKNTSNTTTARIVCCQSDLKKWRAILNDSIKKYSAE